MYYWRTFNQTERNGDDNINNGDDANQKILKRKTKGEGNFGILSIFDLLEKLRMVWNKFRWCSYLGKVEGDWIWGWPKRVKKVSDITFFEVFDFFTNWFGPKQALSKWKSSYTFIIAWHYCVKVSKWRMF